MKSQLILPEQRPIVATAKVSLELTNGQVPTIHFFLFRDAKATRWPLDSLLHEHFHSFPLPPVTALHLHLSVKELLPLKDRALYIKNSSQRVCTYEEVVMN